MNHPTPLPWRRSPTWTFDESTGRNVWSEPWPCGSWLAWCPTFINPLRLIEKGDELPEWARFIEWVVEVELPKETGEMFPPLPLTKKKAKPEMKTGKFKARHKRKKKAKAKGPAET